MIMKIRDFINGFRKIEHPVLLQEEPDFSKLSADTIKRLLSLMKYLPITDVSFGLTDVSITKESNLTMLLKREILKLNKSKSFTKIYCEYYRYAHKKEIQVLNTVFCLGVDDNIWKFEFKSYFTCKSTIVASFDENIVNFLIQMSNDYIKMNDGFSNMLTTKCVIEEYQNYDLLKSSHFDGYVKTYGDDSIFRKCAISDILPEEKTEVHIIRDSIASDTGKTLNEVLDNDSMIIDIIHSVTTSSNNTEITLATV